MPLDLNFYKEFLPLKSDDPEAAKEEFNSLYVLREQAPKDSKIRESIAGAVLGSEMTNFKRRMKEEGIEFTDEEFKSIQELKSHKNESLLEAFIEKMKGRHINEVEEFKKRAGTGTDERVKNLEDELQKAIKKQKDIEAAWKDTAGQLEKERAEGQTKLKQFKIETLLQKERSGLKFKQKMTEAEKLGFEAKLNQSLKFDLDETGNLVVTNDKGDYIPNKAKAGSLMNPSEAMQDLVNQLGLAETNPYGGQPAPKTGQTRTPERGAAEPQGRTILLHGKPVQI